jgi:DNA-binding response OmpR family regulator
MHILIIEDDLDLGQALAKALQANGLSCEWLRRVKDAPLSFRDAGYDGVLLDLSLPDGGGLDLLARWRSAGVTVPVIVITAKSALDDRLAGLDGGADDYVVKPFETVEIIARLRAVLRRCAQQASNVWIFGPLSIEPQANRATQDGLVLDLSRREFQLLLELAREPNTTIAKTLLAHRLEPLGDPVDFSTIDVHVSNLRRKIGARWIKTVRGIGYIFVP